jgi:DNA primase
MANPGDFAYTVKQQADIVRIVGDYIQLRKTGAQNFSGLCPFHNEKSPSFSVHATRQFYHCFGCHASGDVFSFVQKVENITFLEAVRAVAQKLGIPLPAATYNTPAEAQEARRRGVLLDIHEQACEFFREQLRRPEGAKAREYLAGRGLDDQMIQRFRIGFAPDSGFLLKDFLKNKFDEDALRESGLFSWKVNDQKPGEPGTDAGKPAFANIYSKFRNRIQFPIASENGKVIAFTGRTLSTDEKAGPKYLNSPETAIYSKSRVLFNLDLAKEAIRKLGYGILVEGQMDCISVYAAGLHNVIASSGTAFTELQAKLLGRFTKNIVVNFDPDTAGAAATERTLGLLVEEDFQIKVLTLEAGFDPDLFLRRKGKPAYEEALRTSQKYFDYLIERARTQFPVRSAEGKVKALNYLLPHIQRVPSRIVRDELAQEIAHRVGIDSTVLRQELRHAAGNRSAAAVKSTPEGQITPAEHILIRALASAAEIQAKASHVSARDGAEEDFDPARQAQFALRKERLHEGLAAESLLQALLDAGPESGHPMDLPLTENDRKLLASVLMNEEEDLTPELLEGAVKALRRTWVRRRLEAVQREMVEASRQGDSARIAELGAEKLRLKRGLNTLPSTGVA